MEGSPWDEVWKRNGEKVGYMDNTHIDKIKTREWLKEQFAKKE